MVGGVIKQLPNAEQSVQLIRVTYQFAKGPPVLAHRLDTADVPVHRLT